MNEEEQAQLLEDFKDEENLAAFFLFMLRKVKDEAKPEIVFLVAYLWEEYLIEAAVPSQVQSIVNQIKGRVRSKAR